jgi:hypothetical protein
MAALLFRLFCCLMVVRGLTVAPARGDPTGVYEPYVKWRKPEVTVCWARPRVPEGAFTDSEKAQIQALVQREFSVPRNGIAFIGWFPCNSGRRFDVFIETETDQSALSGLAGAINPDERIVGNSEIGEGGELGTRLVPDDSDAPVCLPGFGCTMKRGFVIRHSLKKRVQLYYDRTQRVPGASPMFRVLFTAVHEFGHLSGLRHEHLRPEARQDPNCSDLIARGKLLSPPEPVFETTTASGPYDPNSIMNYCWRSQLKKWGPRLFELRDPEAFHRAEQEPIRGKGSLLQPAEMPWLLDSTLFKVTRDFIPGVDSYEIRLGLSAQDVKAVRCLYFAKKPAGCGKALSPAAYTR